jgi:hypothetical protein
LMSHHPKNSKIDYVLSLYGTMNSPVEMKECLVVPNRWKRSSLQFCGFLMPSIKQ